MSIDTLLARLPQSTNAFSCPWWESFAACCTAAIVLGLCSMTLLGIVPALLAFALLWKHTYHRVLALFGRGDSDLTC